jgi:membrane protease YdiL (CAAX protease family)
VEPSAPTTSPPPAPRRRGPSGSVQALVVALLLPLGILAQARAPLAGLVWTEIFVFLLPAVLLAHGLGLAPRPWLRLRAAPAPAVLFGAVVGLAGWFLGSALYGAARALAPAHLVRALDLSRLFEGPLTEQLAFAAAAGIVAPLCEEVAFRGHLAAAFHARHRPAFAIGVTALLFALLHLDPIRAPALLLLGATYGWLAWRTGSIWPAVAAHATNNATAAAIALALPAPAPADADPTLGMALVGVALGSVGFALAVAAFRRIVPAAPAPADVPLADPADPAPGFRLSRVPRPLLAALAAGWVALGAMLL